MFFPAIAATRFIPNLADAGDVYPTLCAQLLPAGMLGLAIAAMFAATMSTLSGDYNVCASVLTNDVYRRLIRPQASQRELVFVGRIMTLVIGVIALAAAAVMARGKAEDLFRIMVTLFGIATAPVAVPMLLGLVSRRYTNLSAIAGFVFGILTGLGLFAMSRWAGPFSIPGFAWNPGTEEIVLAGLAIKMEIVLFLGTALVTIIAMEKVVFLTWWFGGMAPSEQQRIDTFLARLDTPIGELEEDFSTAPHDAVISPFRVVGICIVIIGLMMLAVGPWAIGTDALFIDIILSVGLVGVGGGLAYLGKRLAKGT
jgi:Na+/proline symporter